ncbi:MAG: DUF4340 domain-containing protein [Rhodanobacteraceae bacterium]|nr:DUF4340 domain-containing protein [Rhodanobacteraceae bacterium]MBK7042271.1 DUF4340 domain-containing protein [Rhodanobacteraceae bacterium]MBP9153815.1 DUF4340 domain-containing protein [Xanthomonadales bacterium]HQW82057.1 DUF4340 domain-containing protein [Pseudomonadota bacterium]
MTRHTLVKLALGTAVAVMLALWATASRGPTDESAAVGEPLLKGLRETINDITELRVVEAGDKPIVTLQRAADGWTVAERGGYPADVSKVRETLISFAEATLIEAKTANPDRHAALGVEDVAKAEAKGMRVEIDGKIPAKVVVGTYSTQGNGSFVRRNDEAQTWLAKGNLVPDRQASNWLEKDIVDIASDRIMRVEIVRGSASFAVLKRSPEQTNYTVESLPVNRELLSEYEANGIASVLAGLKFDDVAKAETVVPDPSSTVVATFRTFDGLVVEITGFASNGKHFVTFNASVDGARADLAANAAQLNAVADYDRAKKNDATAANPTDAAAKATAEALPVPAALADPVAFVAERRKAVDDEAARLTALTKAWVYVLPAYKYANMDKRLEDLLKPKA